jgi:hypothetical protein
MQQLRLWGVLRTDRAASAPHRVHVGHRSPAKEHCAGASTDRDSAGEEAS